MLRPQMLDVESELATRVVTISERVHGHNPVGYVSGGSPRVHAVVRSSGSSAWVRSMCSTASNWSASRAWK